MATAALVEDVSMEGAPLYENVENEIDVEIPSQHRRDDSVRLRQEGGDGG